MEKKYLKNRHAWSVKQDYLSGLHAFKVIDYNVSCRQ